MRTLTSYWQSSRRSESRPRLEHLCLASCFVGMSFSSARHQWKQITFKRQNLWETDSLCFYHIGLRRAACKTSPNPNHLGAVVYHSWVIYAGVFHVAENLFPKSTSQSRVFRCLSRSRFLLVGKLLTCTRSISEWLGDRFPETSLHTGYFLDVFLLPKFMMSFAHHIASEDAS